MSVEIPDGAYGLDFIISVSGGLGPTLEVSSRLHYDISTSESGQPASPQVEAEVEAMYAAMEAYKSKFEELFPLCEVNMTRQFICRYDESFPIVDPMS